MQRPRVETLDDVKHWIADHDGRIDAYWNAQHRWNDQTDKHFVGMESRLTALERRVMLLSGAAAGVGGVLGTIFSRLLGT